MSSELYGGQDPIALYPGGDLLDIIKQRPTPYEVKASEVLWLVAEVDRLRTIADSLRGLDPELIAQWRLSVSTEVERRFGLQQLLEDALTADGAHHKQWYLEQIATHMNILIRVEHDPGVVP